MDKTKDNKESGDGVRLQLERKNKEIMCKHLTARNGGCPLAR